MRAAGPGDDGADGQRRPEVQADDLVDAVHGAGVHHALRAAGQRLLAGLEEEADLARELVLQAREDGGHAEQDGGVAVVAARVHHAGVRGGEGQRRSASSIGSASMSARMASVGPGRPPARRPTTLVPDGARYLDAELGEALGDEPRGLGLLEGQLRMGVQVTAPADDVRSDGGGEIVERIAHAARQSTDHPAAMPNEYVCVVNAPSQRMGSGGDGAPAAIVGAHETPYTRHPAEGATRGPISPRRSRARSPTPASSTARSTASASRRSRSARPRDRPRLAPRAARPLAHGRRQRRRQRGEHARHAVRAIEAGDAETIVLCAGDHLDRAAFRRLVEKYNRATADAPRAARVPGTERAVRDADPALARRHGLTARTSARSRSPSARGRRRNPRAVYREPLTMEEYLARRTSPAADALDCVPVVTGADAVVSPAAPAGRGRAGPARPRARDRARCTTPTSSRATASARASPTSRGGCGRRGGAAPEDVDAAYLYDDYPVMVLVQAAELGLVPGRRPRAVAAPRRARGRLAAEHVGRPALGGPGGCRGRHARPGRGGAPAARPGGRRARPPASLAVVARLRDGALPPRRLPQRRGAGAGRMSELRRLLGCRVPIQQAGFGASLNVDLVAAVAGAGGIGMVGGALGAGRARGGAGRDPLAHRRGGRREFRRAVLRPGRAPCGPRGGGGRRGPRGVLLRRPGRGADRGHP